MTVLSGWIVAEIVALLFVLYLGYSMKDRKGWQMIHKISGIDTLRFIRMIVLPIFFFGISLLIGIIAQFQEVKQGIDVFFVISIVIPCVGIVGLFTYAVISGIQYVNYMKQEAEIKMKEIEDRFNRK